MPISNPNLDLHNINAHSKYGEKSIEIYSLQSGNDNTYRRPYDIRTNGQTDGHIDVQRKIAHLQLYSFNPFMPIVP